MFQKIKNFLTNFIKMKKPVFFIILFLLVLEIFLPVNQVSAWSITSIGKDVLFMLLNVLVGGLFQAIGMIGTFLLSLSTAILDWTTSPDFISLSFTNSGLSEGDLGFNPVIGIGWNLVRNLANLGIVIVLIAIGLGTVLRTPAYHAKKTLPALIVIALLINFTPVICGLIIDASNIVMNFFLNSSGNWHVKGKGLDEAINLQTNFTGQIMTESKPWENLSFLGSTIAYASYAFLGTAILLLYSVLFAMRYIAIWILVILSPIAFLLYILPPTKFFAGRDYFWAWWNQFVQWCLVGIAGAFFLYLSYSILYKISEQGAQFISNPNLGAEVEGAGAFDRVLPFLIVIAFMYIGFFVAMSTSAVGASGVVASFQGATKKIGSWTKKKGWAGAKGAGKGIAAAGAGAAAGAAAGWKAGKVGGALRGGLRGAFSKTEQEKAVKWYRKGLEKMRIAKPGAYEEALKKETGAEAKRIEGMGSKELHGLISRRVLTRKDQITRAAAMEALGKRGELKDKEKTYLPEAETFGADMRTIYKARPDWFSDIKKQVEGTNPGDFRKSVQQEALKNIDVFYAMSVKQLREIEKKGSQKQKQAILETVYRHGPGIDVRIGTLAQSRKPEDKQEAAKLARMKLIVKSPGFRI